MTKKQMLSRYKKLNTLSKLLKEVIEKQPENLTLIKVLTSAVRNCASEFNALVNEALDNAGPLKQIQIKFKDK